VVYAIVSNTIGKMPAKIIRQWGAEADTWAKEGGRKRIIMETA
jgi:hypothetical protein